jgi:hypothetical protein
LKKQFLTLTLATSLIACSAPAQVAYDDIPLHLRDGSTTDVSRLISDDAGHGWRLQRIDDKCSLFNFNSTLGFSGSRGSDDIDLTVTVEDSKHKDGEMVELVALFVDAKTGENTPFLTQFLMQETPKLAYLVAVSARELRDSYPNGFDNWLGEPEADKPFASGSAANVMPAIDKLVQCIQS